MDAALENGDFARAANGRPYQISGAEDKLQRAMILLTVPAGSFRYDPSLGGGLHTLTGQEQNPDGKAFTLVQETLRSMQDITVQSVSYDKTTPPTVKVVLACGGIQKEFQIKL